MINVDVLVDRFAEYVAAKVIRYEDDFGIKPSSSIDWIEPLQDRLQSRFPPPFTSLSSRYEWTPFDLKGIFFFGNTREAQNDDFELRHNIFRDETLSQCLLTHGYIQFGNPDTGDYDRICFDTNQTKHNREHPIVRLEHEAILIYSGSEKSCARW